MGNMVLPLKSREEFARLVEMNYRDIRASEARAAPMAEPLRLRDTQQRNTCDGITVAGRDGTWGHSRNDALICWADMEDDKHIEESLPTHKLSFNARKIRRAANKKMQREKTAARKIHADVGFGAPSASIEDLVIAFRLKNEEFSQQSVEWRSLMSQIVATGQRPSVARDNLQMQVLELMKKYT